MPRGISYKLLVALTLTMAATVAQAAEETFKLVPSDAFGWAVVHRLGEVDAKLQQLLTLAPLPLPPGQRVSVKDTAKTLGIDKGLDLKGDAAVIAMAAKEGQTMPNVVVALPVSDYRAFVEQLGIKKADDAIAEAQVIGMPVLVAHRGNHALLAQPAARDALEAVMAAKPSDAISKLESWLATQDIAVVVLTPGVKYICTTALKSIDEQKALYGEQQKRMSESASKILSVAKEEVPFAAEGILAEKDGTLRIQSRVGLVAGGKASEVFGALKPLEMRLAGLPGGPFVMACGGEMPEFLSRAMLTAVTSAQPVSMFLRMTPEQTEKLSQASLSAVKEPISGMSFAMLVPQAGDPLQGTLIGVLQVDNATRYLEQYEKQVIATSDVFKAIEESPVKSLTAKKVEIDGKTALEVETSVAISKNFSFPGVTPEKMMEMLIGPGGKLRSYAVAADDHHVVYGTTGSKKVIANALAALKDPKSSLGADPAIGEVTAMLPAGAQWSGFVSPQGYFEYIRHAMSAFSGMSPAGLAQPKMPAFPKTLPIGAAVKASPEGLEGEIVVPGATLKAASEYVAAMRKPVVRQTPPQAIPEAQPEHPMDQAP